MAGREHRREACRDQAWGQEVVVVAAGHQEAEARRESRAGDVRDPA